MAIDVGAAFKITATTEGQAQVDKLVNSIKNVGTSGEVSAKMTANAFRMLPAQFTDIATQLAGGQSPFLILLQQGGQVKDSFGGFGNMFRSLAGAITPAGLAIGGAAAALGILGKAFYDGTEESTKFAKALALTGNAAGMTVTDLSRLSKQLEGTTQLTVGATRELVAMAGGSGAFGPQAMEPALRAMARIQELSGAAAQEVVKDFASMSRGVGQWAIEHNRQYGYITVAQLKYIRQLEAQGQYDKAAAYNANLLNDALERRKPQLGTLEKAWDAVKKAASSAWDAMLGIGRNDDDRALKQLEQRLAYLRGEAAREANKPMMGVDAATGAPKVITSKAAANAAAEIEKQIEALKNKMAVEKEAAAAEATEREKNTRAVAEHDRNEAARLDLASQMYKAAAAKKIDTIVLEREEIKAQRDKNLLSESDYIKKAGELNQRELQANVELQNQLKKVEAGRTAKDAPDAAARANRVKAIQMQIDALNREKEAAKRITEMDVDVVEDRKSKQLKYYIEDLKFENDLLKQQSQQVNMTDFEYKKLVETKQRQHEISVKTRGMVASEAEQYRKAAQDAGALKDAIVQVNYEQTRTWQYGAKSALKAYTDEISNAAKLTERFMTNSFRTIEDTLVEFTMTGKLNFKDMATSIIRDLVRIQIQQSIMKPIVGALGNLLGPAAGAMFGGGGLFGNIGTAMQFGTNIGSQQTAMLAAQSFDGGGYTGSGSRSGGLDGKGGFMAMLHPQENVVDNYRGQGGGSVQINVTVNAESGQVQSDGAGDMGRLGAMIGSAVRSTIIQERRPGGLLAA